MDYSERVESTRKLGEDLFQLALTMRTPMTETSKYKDMHNRHMDKLARARKLILDYMLGIEGSLNSGEIADLIRRVEELS